MLELRGVTKIYNKRRVLEDVSFIVEPGQILALCGENGAGKSTCMSIIATIISPDMGEILYKGENVATNPKPLRSELGYVPQELALYDKLTGRENLDFWGKCAKLRKNERIEAISRVSEVIRFDNETLDKKVSEYSGGMKRRLNFAAALLHKPKLLVLDEPTVGMDSKSVEALLLCLKQMAEAGAAIVMADHKREEFDNIATHICVLEEGHCLKYGRNKL